MDIHFIPLSDNHLSFLRSWYREDKSEKHLGGWDYAKSLLDLQKRFPNRFCYVAVCDEISRGIIDLEIDGDKTAWMSVLVDPSRRGQGLGKEILRAFLRHPAVTGIREMKAEVERTNTASLRCFEAAGFVRREDPDTTEGYILLVHEKA